MKEKISGVYKITNTITGEFYVGCSTNIEKRWKVHQARCENKTWKEYNKVLYQSMREYGIDNFKLEILEIVEELDTIFEREMYYINTLQACKYGLNVGQKGEKHGKAKLSTEDVIDIRERYGELESKRSVYVDYMHKISKSGFHKVWNGYTWPDIMMCVYTPENIAYHKNDTGSSAESNPRAKLSNEEVISIRERKDNGEKLQDVYKEYADRMTRGSFKNMWYGCNWKNIA